MGRIDAARETMRKLDWDDRALEASFPEFAAVKDNFTFGEVWQGGVLDTRQRLLVSAACLATVEGGDLEPVLDAALGQGVSPAELQEVFHQSPAMLKAAATTMMAVPGARAAAGLRERNVRASASWRPQSAAWAETPKPR